MYANSRRLDEEINDLFHFQNIPGIYLGQKACNNTPPFTPRVDDARQEEYIEPFAAQQRRQALLVAP